jgi:hypothetical protein
LDNKETKMNDYTDLVVQANSRRERVEREMEALRLAEAVERDDAPMHRRVMDTIGTALVAIGTRLQEPATPAKRHSYVDTVGN